MNEQPVTPQDALQMIRARLDAFGLEQLKLFRQMRPEDQMELVFLMVMQQGGVGGEHAAQVAALIAAIGTNIVFRAGSIPSMEALVDTLQCLLDEARAKQGVQ